MWGPKMIPSLIKSSRKQKMLTISIYVFLYIIFLSFLVMYNTKNSIGLFGCILSGVFLWILFEFSIPLVKYFLINRDLKKRGYTWCKTCMGGGWTPIPRPRWLHFLDRVITGASMVKNIQGICSKCGGMGYNDWVSKVVNIRSNDDSANSGIQQGPS